MKSRRVLLVNPDVRDADSFAQTLSEFGLELRNVRHADEAADACEQFNPELVVLSALLPHANIPELCRTIRETTGAKILVTSPINSATLAFQARHRWDIDEFVSLPAPVHKIAQMVSYPLGEEERKPNLRASGALIPREERAVEVAHGAKKIPLQGDLSEVRIGRLLNMMIRKQFNGSLVLGSAASERRLIVADGRVLEMLSRYLENRGVGDILVRQKQLDPLYLKPMLHEAARQGLRLGEMLIAQRMVGPPALTYALAQQAAEKLSDVFGWNGGPYQFVKDGVSNVREPLNLSLPRVAFHAARLFADPDRFEELHAKWLNEPVTLNHAAAIRPNMLELTADEKRFFFFVQGEKTVRRILAESPLSGPQTRTMLTALISLRMLSRVA